MNNYWALSEFGFSFTDNNSLELENITREISNMIHHF